MDFEFFIKKRNTTEIIKPFCPKKNRISIENKIFYVPLPTKKLSVKWKGKFVAGPNNKTVNGITDQIIQRLDFKSGGGYNDMILNMKTIGNKVDKEIKRFAKDLIGFQYLVTPEAKQIIRHLGKNNITLVTSSVLVSNFKINYIKNEKYSGTEIDVIGYDHNIRKYVIIEVKVTSSTIQTLVELDLQANIDELSKFKNSYIGICKAQLACTTLMFQNTYINDCYPLLVICEKDGICKSFILEEDCVNSKNFSGFIKGY